MFFYSDFFSRIKKVVKENALNRSRTIVIVSDSTMTDSDSDDLLSADFLEPGELLESDDDEQPDVESTSARTSQSLLQNRPKV